MSNSLPPEHVALLAAALRDVLTVEHVKALGQPARGVAFVGRLDQGPDTAYALIRSRFAALGYTATLAQDGPRQIVQAIEGVVQPGPRRVWPNLILFLLTLMAVLLTGALQETDQVAADFGDLLAMIGAMLIHPTRLLPGVPFAFTVMLILGTHEMGHYIMGRRHKADVSLPYFIPLPFISPFGTLGAVIVQRSPFEDRRSLFDVGLAGPLAGLLVALPLLLIGLAHSSIGPYQVTPSSFFEGNSLLYLGLKYLVHGRLLPANGLDVYLSPVALGAWFGLIVTFLNLLPVGQLDGGHVLYALLGQRAWPIGQWLTRLLLAAGSLGLLGEVMGLPILAHNFWAGWFVWGLFVTWMHPRHPPPLNDLSQLDTKRKLLGILAGALFVLLFTRIPFSTVPVLY